MVRLCDLPCLCSLADVERVLAIRACDVLAWVARGELRPAATDPGGRPLFPLSDVRSTGKRLAAATVVRLFQPGRSGGGPAA